MGKEKQSTKEAKKQPLLSPKEKKAAKQAKKHAAETMQPMIPALIPHRFLADPIARAIFNPGRHILVWSILK
ncbi:MAG: hypothetical protein IPL58_01680 [Betaproteobacteria bacterium]|uniref:Uncharacterized protein n=1 Tax=Candidatus Proximibacter danicus TaxID=2954365 RepID=A0A9D7K1B6_9PROT|nr:hypothetical protein [Candidatus Proximibacter danicus]